MHYTSYDLNKFIRIAPAIPLDSKYLFRVRLCRSKLAPRYSGPWTIVRKLPNGVFIHFIIHFIIFIQVKGSYIDMFFNLTCFKRLK